MKISDEEYENLRKIALTQCPTTICKECKYYYPEKYSCGCFSLDILHFIQFKIRGDENEKG